MKHYRAKVEEKEPNAPTSRCERRQQHEDPNWNRTEHPEKPRELVSLVNMSQAGDDTKDNGDGIAGFAFRCFSRAVRPVTSVAVVGTFRQQMPAVWTGYLASRAWFGVCWRCVSVLNTHFID